MFAESVRFISFIMQHDPFFIHNRVLIKVAFLVDGLLSRTGRPSDFRKTGSSVLTLRRNLFFFPSEPPAYFFSTMPSRIGARMSTRCIETVRRNEPQAVQGFWRTGSSISAEQSEHVNMIIYLSLGEFSASCPKVEV
jgi:hypothetical protein